MQGDLGSSKISDRTKLMNGATFSQRISTGCDFGNYRIAADYTNFGNIERVFGYSVYSVSIGVATKAKYSGWGISAIYDFENSSNFTPYLGARLGYNKVNLKATAKIVNSPNTVSDSVKASRVGVGALAGVQYKLTDKFQVNLGAEYNRLPADYSQIGVNAGLRYNF